MFPGGGVFDMMNQMNQMMNSMLQDPFFSGAGTVYPPHTMQPQQQYMQQTGNVEEVPHAQRSGARGTAPIVEEPDDDEASGGEEGAPDEYQQQAPQYQQQVPAPPAPQYQQAPAPDMMLGMPLMNPFGGLFGNMFGGMGMGMPGMPGMDMNMPQGRAGGGGGQVYTYSSSSMYTSGPNGTYSNSTTARQAPGGVRETQKTVRDGRTGHESMTIARGIGDRERVISRSRDATGQIQTHERNRGLDPERAANFDQEWVQHAEQVMPSWMNPAGGAGRAQQLQGSNRQQQQQLALPPGAAAGQQQQQQGVYGAGAGGYQGMQQQGYYGGAGGQHQQYQQPHGGAGSSSGSGWRGGGYHV